MPLNNFDKWKSYTSGLSSPDSFLDWSWLYIVGAALQRRVWMGPENQPCYANKYVILVGAPGIGKGLSIREVTDFLKHWKLEDVMKVVSDPKIAENKDFKQQVEMSNQSQLDKAQEKEFQGGQKRGEMFKPLLFPVCADAITYEALVQAVGECYRYINYIDNNGKLKPYGHSSLCFSLQELSSLLRKRTNDTVNYLLGLYDCPVDYEYSTLTRGKDRVRRGCLNIIAGTTPSFMQGTFDEKLMDEGFTSRTFYVFANKNRKNQFWIPPLTDSQKTFKSELLDHVRQLSTLYGPCVIDDTTADFLQHWWDEQEKNKHTRANKSLKMVPYYSRKNIHVMKIAMAMHFGESLDMNIPLERFKEAIAFLEKEERNMHLALTLEGNNPQSKISRKLLEFLSAGKKDFVTMLAEIWPLSMGNAKKDLEEVIDFLVTTNQIERTDMKDETTDENVSYWRLKI